MLKIKLFFRENGVKRNFNEIKMDNYKVVQLTAIAKERGIKGYYKLRKSELIHALEATRLVEQKRKIFDEPIPNDPTPILQPILWESSNIVTKVKQHIKNLTEKSMQKIKDFGNWLLNYIPPKPKVVDKVLESFKNKIKKCMKRGIHCSNQYNPNLL